MEILTGHNLRARGMILAGHGLAGGGDLLSIFANGEDGSSFPIADHNGDFAPSLLFSQSEDGSHFPIADHNGGA